MTTTLGLARSWLFAPADHARRREKALQCGADAVILDLEDAVAAGAKAGARDAAAGLLDPGGAAAVYVRINGLDTRWCYPDLLAVVRAGLAGIVVPKVERADDLRILDWVIGQLESERELVPGSIRLVGLVETAAGVEALDAIAAACPRLARLGFGVADYSLDLGLVPSPDEEELGYVRARLVHVSRVARLAAPLDSVVVEYRDGERFLSSARRGRSMGLGGKLCIHPDQVPLANEVFAPSAAEIATAEAVVAAWQSGQGQAALSVAGQFVDGPVVERARRVLAAAGRAAQG